MKKITIVFCFSIFLLVSVVCQAQKAAEYTSREDVAKNEALNRDFQIQGEYVGLVNDNFYGVDVIADGNGKFRFVAFEDGLPGLGWKRGEDREFCDAALNADGDLVITPKEQDEKPTTFKVSDGNLQVEGLVSLIKVERKSPTLGLKAPEDAVVLFVEGNKTAKARITVQHNGVKIHDGIEPEKETPGCKKEAPEARGLYLQGHGNKVQYRNIWIKYE